MFEKDYVMRIIKDIARMLAKILFNKEIESDATIYLEREEDRKSLKRLNDRADRGEINEAENELYGLIESGEQNVLPIAIDFYEHLNELEDDFLEAHNYSRAEILEGLKMILKEQNMTGLIDAFDSDLNGEEN